MAKLRKKPGRIFYVSLIQQRITTNGETLLYRVGEEINSDGIHHSVLRRLVDLGYLLVCYEPPKEE